MAVQDPRILIILLEDLIEELRRWRLTTRDTLTDMSWHQRQGEEKVQQAQHHAAIVMEQARQDRDLVDRAAAEVSQLLSKCHQAQNNARQNLQQAEQIHLKAQSNLSHWQGELEAALAWLARAEARLRRAIAERIAAEENVRQAKAALESARSALASCENSGYTDKDGVYHAPNCSAQRAALSSAEVNLNNAKHRLQAAIAEENAARDEVARAQARVNCCRQAVGYAQQAVSHAHKALTHAHDALSYAERSLENAQAARRAVERAQIEVTAEQEMADLMATAVNTAQSLTVQARRDFHQAEHLGESAQRLEIAVSKELEDKVEYLIELNRPLEL